MNFQREMGFFFGTEEVYNIGSSVTSLKACLFELWKPWKMSLNCRVQFEWNWKVENFFEERNATQSAFKIMQQEMIKYLKIMT